MYVVFAVIIKAKNEKGKGIKYNNLYLIRQESSGLRRTQTADRIWLITTTKQGSQEHRCTDNEQKFNDEDERCPDLHMIENDMMILLKSRSIGRCFTKQLVGLDRHKCIGHGNGNGVEQEKNYDKSFGVQLKQSAHHKNHSLICLEENDSSL